MKPIYPTVLVLIVCTAFSSGAETLNLPQEDLPLIVNGVVMVDDEPPPAGTEIAAVIDQIQVARTPLREDGSYAMLIEAEKDDIGKVVEFFVDNTKIDYTTSWAPNQVERVDISLNILRRGVPKYTSVKITSPTGQVTEGQALDLTLIYPTILVLGLLGVLYYLRTKDSRL